MNTIKIIGIGFMSFSNFDEAVSTVNYALSHLPPNYKLLIDTAQLYGNFIGDNETLLGKVLEQFNTMDHKKIIVVTKGGVKKFSLETETPDHSLFVENHNPDEIYCNDEELYKMWYDSKNRLGVDKHKDITWCYMLHRRHPTQIIFERQLEILKLLHQKGDFTYTGLSEVSLIDLQFAKSILPIYFLESEFSMNVQFLNVGYVNYCMNNNIRILGYCPLSRGFWSDSNSGPDKNNMIHQVFSMWQPENYSKLQPMLNSVRKFAKNKGITTAQLVLAWITHKNVIPISGSASFFKTQRKH